VSAANKYIDESAPWTLAKDEKQRDQLATVMYNLLEGTRIIALLVKPFMPETGARILAILGCDPAMKLDGHDSWGGLLAGTTVEKAAPLFPRIEAE